MVEGDDRRLGIVLNMSSTPLCVRLQSCVSQNHHGFKEMAAADLTTKYGWCCSPQIGIHKMPLKVRPNQLHLRLHSRFYLFALLLSSR